MFWNKGKKKTLIVNDDALVMNEDVYNYINLLQTEKRALELELKSIKPILEYPELKPAVSKHCEDCEFAVIGDRWYVSKLNAALYNSPQLLGCRRHGVCEDFKARDTEEE